MLPSGQDPRMSLSYQSGPSEGESSDMGKKKRVRPTSRSSKVSQLF